MKIKLNIGRKFDHHDRFREEEEEEENLVDDEPRVDRTVELRVCDFLGKICSSGKVQGRQRRSHLHHLHRDAITKLKPGQNRGGDGGGADLEIFRTEKAEFQTERDCSNSGTNQSSGSSAVSDGDHTGSANLTAFLTGWSRTGRRGKRHSDPEDVDALNPNPVPFKKRKIEYTDLKRYECVTCNRSFSSFQALGGHRSSHSKVQIVNKSKDEERKHMCKICDKSFTSGQALGGHQRRHWAGPDSSPASSPARNGLKKIFLFDLNELPPEE